MTVFFLDPGIQTFSGHHTNTVFSLSQELRRRGQDVRVVGHRHLAPNVVEALGAEPFFSLGTYEVTSTDPICGPLETLIDGAVMIMGDLRRLNPVPGDVMVWPTARPHHIVAMGNLLRSWPSPVLSVFTAGFRCAEPESAYWRFACRRLPPAAPVVLAATADLMAGDYADVVGRPFVTAPNPHEGRFRDRSGADPVVIGVLGHQRPAKGTQLLPQVIRWTRGNARWLVHDSGTDAGPILDDLETLPNVRVVRSKTTDWQGLLDSCDALLMPYSRTEYERMHSGLVAEAIACGLPFVIPDAPALVEQASEAGCVAYDGDGAEAVTDAVETLLQHFKPLAWAARSEAARYAERNGPGRWVDWLMQRAADAGLPGCA
ncbi:glycosyltransferase [Azospirillum sp.]|uniref:glycosyltransferase n=1 Tax=Azospirillum sp. TaxID=34012 RepID=UPI003D71DB3D